ncbi:Cell division protein ZapA [Bacteroidales bacterium Barb6]|nr:Cell division protein ZapA [Bacteroidales bacterium Barb6XT]OAV70391.1 Cell division protein ZapA [Bacteroidales bacterium Barb6]
MDDKFLIHVDIADDTYGLRIRREDEQLFRDAAKLLRMTIHRYRQKYTDSEPDLKALLAMAALQLATDKLYLQGKNDTTPFTEKIQQLTDEISTCLKGT